MKIIALFFFVPLHNMVESYNDKTFFYLKPFHNPLLPHLYPNQTQLELGLIGV